MNTLWGARCKWHSIGLELGIDPDNLDAVKLKDHGNPDECFKEILTEWLRGDCPQPTWSAMAKALRAPSVGFGQLASKVEQLQTPSVSFRQLASEIEQLQVPSFGFGQLASEVEQLPIVINQFSAAAIGSDGKTNATINATEGPVFRCPCGMCSLESYLKSDCPRPKLMPFPYLNLSKLDEDEREDLIQRLSDDLTKMITKFAKLFNEICESLQSRDVTTQRLARQALSLGAYESQNIQKPLLSEDEKDLRSSKNIDESFIILRHHMSFFNYELLEHIVDSGSICSEQDRQQLDKYRTEFKEFCRRKVFEVPPDSFGSSTVSKTKQRKFVVLITKHEAEPNLVYIDAARKKIASLLGLMASTLHLHRIDKGSLILVFSVPTFVAERLFPLYTRQINDLKAEGYTIFTLDSGILSSIYLL